MIYWLALAWVYVSGTIIYWAALPDTTGKKEVAYILLWPLITIPMALTFSLFHMMLAAAKHWQTS